MPQRVARTFCAFFAILLPFFFTSFFRCLFASILARFCLPTCLPKSTKIDEKSMPRCLPMLTSFFDRFLMGFCSQLRPPEPQKSSPRCSESTIFQKIAIRILHRFSIDVGANMPPFSLQKSIKILPKIDPKMHQFYDRFLHRCFIDCPWILEAKTEPSWDENRTKKRCRLGMPIFEKSCSRCSGSSIL